MSLTSTKTSTSSHLLSEFEATLSKMNLKKPKIVVIHHRSKPTFNNSSRVRKSFIHDKTVKIKIEPTSNHSSHQPKLATMTLPAILRFVNYLIALIVRLFQLIKDLEDQPSKPQEESVMIRVPLVSAKFCINCRNKYFPRTKRLLLLRSVGDRWFMIYQLHKVVVGNRHRMCMQCYEKADEDLDIHYKLIPINNKYHQMVLKMLSKSIQKHNSIKNQPIVVSQARIHVSQVVSSDMKEICGLTLQQIEHFHRHYNLEKQSIFETFTILRHNLPRRFSAKIFGVAHTTISRHFIEVISTLGSQFAPKYLNQSREWIAKHHVPAICKALFPNVKGIIDGTYFYCQKSRNFKVQKMTFSMHKHRNLVKAMGIVLPDGRWWDIIGPYYSDGKHNDKWLWDYIVTHLRSLLQRGFKIKVDEFLADRGFIKCESSKDYYKLWFPGVISRGNRRPTWKEANASRLVTKIRNVVERAFGRLKQWKFLFGMIDSAYLKSNALKDIPRIIAAIQNKWSPPLFSTHSDVDLEMVQYRKNMPNWLDSELTKINKRTGPKPKWVGIKDISGWMRTRNITYSQNDIRRFACGPYAMSLAQRYISHSSSFKFYCSTTMEKQMKKSNLLKVRGTKSRYRSARSYVIHLHLTNDINDLMVVCSCKSGLRTIGGCAHVIAVLCALSGVIPPQTTNNIVSISERKKQIRQMIEDQHKHNQHQQQQQSHQHQQHQQQLQLQKENHENMSSRLTCMEVINKTDFK